jgi:multiple sugar transport system substrate-binding protein
VVRHVNDADEATMAGTRSPEKAASEATERINDSIAHTIQEDADLAAEYERRLKIQQKIDQRRAAGQPVPLEWINNVFYRRYYREQGWLE